MIYNKFEDVLACIHNYKGDEEADKILTAVEKYESLGMTKAKACIEDQAVAFVLNKLGMTLIKAIQDDAGYWARLAPASDREYIMNKKEDYRISTIAPDGTETELTYPIGNDRKYNWWHLNDIKDYAALIPFDILSKMDTGVRDLYKIFKPNPRFNQYDPILVIKIEREGYKQFEEVVTYNIEERRHHIFFKKCEYVKNEPQTVLKSCITYWVMIAKWD